MADPLRFDMTLPDGQPLRFDMGPEFTWDGNVPANLQPNTPMQQNDISITVTAQAEADVLAKAEALRLSIAAFAVSLTAAERDRYFKLGDARLAFDEKCDNYMHQRADLVPVTVSVPEYDKDGGSTAAVKRIKAKVGTVDAMLDDTLTVLGSDRLDADLKFYHYLELLAEGGVAGAAEIHADLKATYPGRGTSKPKPASPKANP